MIEYENLANTNQPLMHELEDAAKRVIRSGWYVLGQEVSSFEAEFAAFVGSKHCVGVGSGLDALILTLEAMGLPPGSDVLVASNTYIATILSIVRAGHRPVLVEPERETFNIDPAGLSAALTSNTRAVCVTHMFGKPCRMDAIESFARLHGLGLIEDCAQSHGAKLKGQMTGTFGTAGCFSFYPTKNLGAIGEAGAVVTDDDELADRLRCMRNYGSRQKNVSDYIGINSRLDELQAAFLRVKLRQLDSVIEHKRALAEVYFEALPSWVCKPVRRDDEFDVFHVFGIRHENRDALRSWLLQNEIKTEIHYPTPPHRQEAMKGVIGGDFPIADELHDSELSLPVSAGHSIEQIEQVVECILNAPAALSHSR